jgi:hypothetical protein
MRSTMTASCMISHAGSSSAIAAMNMATLDLSAMLKRDADTARERTIPRNA